MPRVPNKELEERLRAAGETLSRPPSSPDQLLPILDGTEKYLSKVQQSPASSIVTALSPLTNALVSEKLLKHSDVDVRVGVASCISEITRITAPEAPYDDDKMKDVLQLIVSSFEDIPDTSSRSYLKRVAILETVAKVRSCVIMLDLECDQMVIEMFQHFLKAIRDYHAEVVFNSMETIMTIILEESEDISLDILNPILSTLKKNNETVLPVAKKLAERVIRSSTNKLRTYLPQALKALNASFKDYSEVLASTCQDSIESVLNDELVTEMKSTSSSPVGSPSPQVVQESTEETATNGANEPGTEGTVVDANCSKKADSDNVSDANLVSVEPAMLEAKVDQVAKENGRQSNSDNYSAESPDAVDSKKQSEQVNTGEDIPTSPNEVLPLVEAATSLENVKGTSVQLSPSEPHENEDVNVSTPVQVGSLPEQNQVKRSARTKRKGKSVKKQKRSGRKQPAKKANKKDGSLIEEDESKKDDGNASDSETKSIGQIEKMKVSDEENNSGAKKQKDSGNKLPTKKAEKESTSIEGSKSKNDGGNASESEMNSLDQTGKLKVSDDENIPVAKMQKGTGKKKPAKKAKADSTLVEEGDSKNDGGNASDSEANSLDKTENLKVSAKKQSRSRKKQPVKKAKKDVALIEENESENNGGSDSDMHDASPLSKVGKKSGVKTSSEKDGSKSSVREDDGEDMVTSPRSPLRSTKDGSNKEKSRKMSSKRKRTPGTEKDMVTSPRSPLRSTKDGSNKEKSPMMSSKRKQTPGTEKASGTIEYGENLIGSKITVWWPQDRAFYEGVIHSFDSVKKKHAVLYADGDQENLNLKREKWKFVGDDPVSDAVRYLVNHLDSVENSSDDASPDMKKKKKRTSSEASSKHVKMEISDKSKLKDIAKKSGVKSKNDDKIKPKTKDNSKSSGKSEDETVKSKDSAKATGKSKDVAKTPNNSKQDSQKAAKSKGKTPQSAIGSSSKSGSSKAKETDKEIVKGKSHDTPKA